MGQMKQKSRESVREREREREREGERGREGECVVFPVNWVDGRWLRDLY